MIRALAPDRADQAFSIGALSDRTRNPRGRRRPFLFLSAVSLAAASVLC
jgi:Na+/melibiose symporter-like transporter